MDAANNGWFEANQRYLAQALVEVREAIERQVPHEEARSQSHEGKEREMADLARVMDEPPALEILSAAFSLSAFERALLLLCAGIELDSRFGQVCAAAHGSAVRTYPTFSLGPV